MQSGSLLCGRIAEAIYLQGALMAVLLAGGWAWTGYVRLCELRRQRALAQAPPGGGRADDEERLGRCTSPAPRKGAKLLRVVPADQAPGGVIGANELCGQCSAQACERQSAV
jgi:hypothetical protein